MGSDAAPVDPILTGIVDEVMKRTGVCWLRYAGSGRDRPVWHLWREGAAYVVSGGSEQPLPGIERVGEATVIARTKDSRERLLAWRAAVATVRPGSHEYQAVVRELLVDRLNLENLGRTWGTWVDHCTITRLRPTGVVDEQPGALPDGDLAEVPLPTPATTEGALPRVVHRRKTRRPKLS